MAIGLQLPDALGVDTSLTGDGTSLGTSGSLASGGSDQALAAPEFSAMLDVASFDDFKEEVHLKQGGITPGGFKGGIGKDPGDFSGDLRKRIVSFGKQFLGMPYVWGGSSPKTSFDCSGLVQYVAGKFGLNLPRVSYAQANSGTRVSLNKLRPGDLVAWDNSSRNHGADHIAFYIGNGMILEAPHSGAKVRIRRLGRNEGAWGVALRYPGDGGVSRGGSRNNMQ